MLRWDSRSRLAPGWPRRLVRDGICARRRRSNRFAAAEQRILLTEDKDFGELVVRLGLPAHGIVLLRLNPADSAAKLERLREVLLHDATRLPHCFVVVDAKKARFRSLPNP
jgi:hypothetical protein